MEVIYHPLVRRDVVEILRYYQDISPKLADEFEDELRATLAKAVSNPLRFHLTRRGFRRATLNRFPYHFIYEVQTEVIRVMVVRHNKRHPEYGMGRA